MFATGKLGVLAAVRQGPGKEFGGWSYRQGMAELLAQFWKKKKNAQVAFPLSFRPKAMQSSKSRGGWTMILFLSLLIF